MRERRRGTMSYPTRAAIGLVRMGESSFVPANPEDDLCGKDVYTIDGKAIGSVEDLYIDRQEREIRFLEVGLRAKNRLGQVLGASAPLML